MLSIRLASRRCGTGGNEGFTFEQSLHSSSRTLIAMEIRMRRRLEWARPQALWDLH